MAQSLFTSSAVLSISAADWRTFPPRPPLVLSAKSPHKCQRCSYCFKFETKKNFSRYGAVRDNFAPYDSSTLKVSLKDAVQAAQDDCQFHQWILHLILRNIHDPNPKFPSHAEVEITLNLQKIYKTEFIPHDFIQQDGRRLKWDPSKRLKETLTEPFIQYRYQAASSPYCVDVRASIKRVNGIVASGCDSFSFCRTGGYSADLKDDIPCITRTPMIEWDKRSERSLGFVRTCLSTCRELHLDCKPLNRSKREPRVPTRLLHIQSASSTGYVRLIDFARLASAPGAFKGYLMLDYAILSYCWGGPQFLTLTESNIEILLDRIPVAQLGQTIQDSITVCNELHISFLWIDALCILQDSSADMQHELSMMSTYYQHGVLTICAASAKSSAEGFLSSREHNSYAVGPFEMIFEEGQRRLPEIPKKRNFTLAFDIDEIRRERFSELEKSGELQKLAGRPTQHAVQLFKLHDERPAEPIASRAWTFQEAILSTRLLIFASSQVYWCCHEHYVGCGGIHSFEKTQVVHPDCPGEQSKACICGVSLIRRIDPPDLVPGVFTLGYRNTLSTDTQWDMLVTEFSGRALTMASDKLVAFSAAASYFDTLFRARWPSVQYVAGLWYSDESPLSFLRQLLWSSENPETAYRVAIFRAPTWSWASIDGQIKQFDKLQMLLNSHISLEVVKVVTQIAVCTAPFGAVDSGRLMVRGKLRSLSLFQDTGPIPLGEYPVPGLKVLPDTPDDEAFISPNINQLYLLEVIPYTVTNLAPSPSPIGIVLCELDSLEETSEGYISTFKRIGTFSFPGDRDLGVAANIFDDCAKEHICIL